MKRISISLAALLLGGCMALQARRPDPATHALARAASFRARTLDSASLRRYFAHLASPPAAFPPRTWTLPLLSEVALYYRPDVAQARARMEIAQAGRIVAGSGPAARIALTPGYAFGSPAGTSPWFPGIALDLPIETAGKRAFRLAAADRRIAAAHLDLQTTSWHVGHQVHDALVAYIWQQRRASLLQIEVTLRAELLRLLRQRLAAGALSEPETLTAALALDRARLGAQAQRGKLLGARLALAAAVGVPGRALDGIKFSWPGFSRLPAVPPEPRLQRAGLANRTDVQSALLHVLEADDDVRVAEAGACPDVHLGPGYKWDQGENKISLALSVAIPQARGPIAEARARRDLAAATFDRQQDQAIGQIEQARAAYGSAVAELYEVDETLSAARQHDREIEQRFSAGQVDRVELDDAKLEAVVAQLTRLDVVANGQNSLERLQAAIQTPLSALEGPK